MKLLLEYLDQLGWFNPNTTPGFPAQRLMRANEVGYQWMILSPTSAQLLRTRWPEGKLDAELFILEDEISCLKWAQRLNNGIHPDSLDRDPKWGGQKIGHLS